MVSEHQQNSCTEKLADLYGSQSRMSKSAARNHSSTTRTTFGSEPQYDFVLNAPPKESLKQPAAKDQWTSERTHSKSHPKQKPAASKFKSPTEELSPANHPARKPSSAKRPSSNDHTTGKSPQKQKAASAKDQPSKSSAPLSTDPILGYLTIDEQPNLSPANSVEALRLPCHDSNVRITNIALTEIGRHDTRLEDCNEGEGWLRRFPKMKDLDNGYTFSWEDRRLLAIDARGLGGSFCTKYMIYVCCKEEVGLALNEDLTKFSGEEYYGDCFLFKIHCFNEYGDPEFLHMGQESVKDLEKNGATKEILRKLLTPLRSGVEEGQEDGVVLELRGKI